MKHFWEACGEVAECKFRGEVNISRAATFSNEGFLNKDVTIIVEFFIFSLSLIPTLETDITIVLLISSAIVNSSLKLPYSSFSRQKMDTLKVKKLLD